MKYKFPKNFYWGTSTSSHQIEGNNTNNDWWRAEQEGKVPHKSKVASDSYNRYEEDFDLARELGTNAHRFSIEWSRIEPEEGKFNEEAIEHYKKVIRALRDRGMEPFVTLHHFANPIWFADLPTGQAGKGGWENKKAPFYFARYAEYVVKNFPDVKYWITINEPLIYASISYRVGKWPPHKKSGVSAIRVARIMAKAHKAAYRVIKKASKDAQVGTAKNNNYFEPYEGQLPSKAVAFFADYIWNKWFLNKVNNEQDFVGINHYNRNRIHVRFSNPKHWFNQNENKEVSDFGWEIYPESIYHVVKQAWETYKKPVYIFENGLADADDDQRPAFIRNYLKWLHKAIEEGADVRGYFHWSLLDNFEWAEGYTMKFGLVEVDFDTLRRTPRGSFYVYKSICEANGFNNQDTRNKDTNKL